MAKQLISVIIPVYNAERFVHRALESVLTQTYSHWELVVIDDCSTDGSARVLSSYAEHEPRIRLLQTAENSRSPSVPRNLGVETVRGEYIAFLDADDEWDRNKLARQLKLMTETHTAISATGYLVLDALGRQVGRYTPPITADFSDLLKENVIGCSTAMYDVNILGKRRFPRCGHEDYALWLDIVRDGHTVRSIAEPLAIRHLRIGSVSSNKFRVAGYFWHIYRRRLEYSALRSSAYTFRYLLRGVRRYLFARMTANDPE